MKKDNMLRYNKKCLHLCFCCVIFCFYSLMISKPLKKKSPIIQVQKNQFIISDDTNILRKDFFKVLFWTNHFSGPAWFGEGQKPFLKCQYKNCMSTADHSQYNKSDAVLFHMRFLHKLSSKSLPTYRHSTQKWIMHIFESQAYEPSYTIYNGLFNATWTFKHNSDIWTNYSHVASGGLFQKLKMPNISLINTNYAEKKSKLVAWFVSQCSETAVTSGRMS